MGDQPRKQQETKLGARGKISNPMSHREKRKREGSATMTKGQRGGGYKSIKFCTEEGGECHQAKVLKHTFNEGRGGVYLQTVAEKGRPKRDLKIIQKGRGGEEKIQYLNI